MTSQTLEWTKNKAESLLRETVDSIARTHAPSAQGDLAQGMLEMAYALGVLGDMRYGYWSQVIAMGIARRQEELRVASYG